MKGDKEKSLPEKKFRAGSINATLWKNKGTAKNGSSVEFNTVSLDRNYKDKDGNWQSTHSLRVNDVPKAILVLNKIYEHLMLKESGEEVEVEDIE